MAKIAYVIVAGQRPSDVRFVANDYKPLANEAIIEGDILPDFPLTESEKTEIAAREADVAKREADITNNLPSWEKVKAAIDAAFTNANQNAVVTKLARIVYWLAKGSAV